MDRCIGTIHVTQMKEYVHRHLQEGEAYLHSMPKGCNCRNFFEIPIKLAVATMRVREEGQHKLTRQQVIEICKV
jgi:phytoene/squalene synthetase